MAKNCQKCSSKPNKCIKCKAGYKKNKKGQCGTFTRNNTDGVFISDTRIQLLSETRLCKSRELSQRGSSMSQPCSIHHEFAVAQYTPGACAQWSESGHNADKQLTVLGTRCVTLWLWYDQFEIWLLQPLQLL